MRIEDDIVAIARQSPDRPAIETDDRVLTFGQLEAASRRWADQLEHEGLPRGAPVWICLPNGPEFILAVLAVLRAGGVPAPVHTRLGDHELRQLARVCLPVAAWCTGQGRRRLHAAFQDETPPCIVAATKQDTDGLEIPPGSWPPDRTLYAPTGLPGMVYFTSGSTGRPKAILLTHANVASNARATAKAFGLRAEDRSVVCMPMCHSYTLTKQVLAHLGVGASLVLGPDFFQPVVVLDRAAERRATTLCAVPSMHAMMLEQVRRQPLVLPALRLLVTGGAPMPHRVLAGWCEAFPRADFISSYGLSEASPSVAALKPEWAQSRAGSVGLPVPGVEVRVVADDGTPASPGTVGELCVRGPNVMAGYLNDPGATAAALRDGWLHTGDLAYQDGDGCLYLQGRRDDLILRGGENIYPAEVEDALCRHPAVLEAAVVGLPHPILGQEVAAFVVLHERASVDPDVLRRHCRRYVAPFKVPREVRVVDALPRTSNGKLCRRALRDRGEPGPAAVAGHQEEGLS